MVDAIRPFRFGLEATSASSADAWRELARKAEDLGFSTLHVSDHLDDQYASVPALMAAADATSTLRVGALVFANDFRHPVVVAKEAATIDVLSDGRYELGLGAGWMRSDYAQSGLPYSTPGERVSRFDEAVTVIRSLLEPERGPVTFHGEHYQITDHECRPAPVQERLPVLIGGGGRRMLSIAGRHADIVSINFNLRHGELTTGMWSTGTAAATDEKIGWVRSAAGERAADLEWHIDAYAVVTKDREGTLNAMARDFGMSPDAFAEAPHAVVGSPAQIADILIERRERFGFSYITFMAEVLDDLAPVVARLAGS